MRTIALNVGALDRRRKRLRFLEDKTVTLAVTVDPTTLPLEQTITDLGFTHQVPVNTTQRTTTMNKATVHIEGMARNHCKITSVEKGLGALDGVQDATFLLNTKPRTCHR